MEGSRIVELSGVCFPSWRRLSLPKESSHSLPGPVVGCLGAFLVFLKGLAVSQTGRANLSRLARSWGGGKVRPVSTGNRRINKRTATAAFVFSPLSLRQLTTYDLH